MRKSSCTTSTLNTWYDSSKALFEEEGDQKGSFVGSKGGYDLLSLNFKDDSLHLVLALDLKIFLVSC